MLSYIIALFSSRGTTTKGKDTTTKGTTKDTTTKDTTKDTTTKDTTKDTTKGKKYWRRRNGRRINGRCRNEGEKINITKRNR